MLICCVCVLLSFVVLCLADMFHLLVYEGPIPEQLGELRDLGELSLHNNQLAGQSYVIVCFDFNVIVTIRERWHNASCVLQTVMRCNRWYPIAVGTTYQADQLVPVCKQAAR